MVHRRWVLALFMVFVLIGLTACGTIAGSDQSEAARQCLPSDRRASQAAKDLLAWFCSLAERTENRVLSGQEIGSVDAYQGYYEYVTGLYRRTGFRPAIISLDYVGNIGDPSFIDVERKTDVLLRHWRSGGLVSVHAHLGNPWNRRGVHDQSREDGAFADAYTPGTGAYEHLKRDFDLLAKEFRRLEDEGVVVLFRPFHEANGGWFWWHTSEPEEFKALWRYWHRYLTEERNLHNLLFVYSPSPVSSEKLFKQGPEVYYPGDSWVDITGLDLYRKDLKDIPSANYRKMIALGKPFGFGELGASFPPTPENKNWDLRNISTAMEKYYKEAVYWFTWSSWSPTAVMSLVDLPHAEELFHHPLIMALEDVDAPPVPAPSVAVDEESEISPAFKIGIAAFSRGIILGEPDCFEEGVARLKNLLGGDVEIIQVRGVLRYRCKETLQRLLEEERVDMLILEDTDDPSGTLELAIREYPETLFLLPVSGDIPEAENVFQYGINSSGWYYLTGLIAGALTETDRIGYIAPSYDPWNIEHANEFALGVEETAGNEAEILFYNSAYETFPALGALLDTGCDVFNACIDWTDTVWALEEARRQGKPLYAFSYMLSRNVLPGVLAAAQPDDLGLLLYRMIQEIRAGRKISSPYWTGIRDGIIRLGSGDPPLDEAVSEILSGKAMPGHPGMTVYDYVLSRHRELRDGGSPLPPVDSKVLRPGIRDVTPR
ncbi:MAG: hypothetical protein JW760_04335 [Spirochaetales bacterium]|nr:hypothetical protein [Spirochaetales bacterium]